MKIRWLFCVSVFALFIFVACNNKEEKSSEQTTAYKSKNSDSFNIAFDSVITAYNNLKDAFINWDTAAANNAATSLQTLVISVPYEKLSDEENATKATSIAQNAMSEIDILKSQDSIASKRRIFYTLSESIYSLIKTTGYDKAVVYHKKCPMAFNGDQEGWWFSETKKVNDNPYYGKFHPKYKSAMLECGTVEDSVNNMH